MVNAGNAFKGKRIGTDAYGGMAGWQAESGRIPVVADRTIVSYWCMANHESRPTFAKLHEDEIPEVWDCCRCGRPAGRLPGVEPLVDCVEPFKSHLQYVKERRSDEEAARVLEQALCNLRARRTNLGSGLAT
ncbi:RNA polymerase-binding protein RbpA [Arthrobacter sp. H20]|uniref:RNA polymerase-binding protein RbpA n=1 Tax=Arthrobacter sp. H20 TaxID=1267981 RepID=UPI00047AD2F2|nr:RNA polymerase-binding protein RbpA [Arthrobacter sp. H20]